MMRPAFLVFTLFLLQVTSSAQDTIQKPWNASSGEFQASDTSRLDSLRVGYPMQPYQRPLSAGPVDSSSLEYKVSTVSRAPAEALFLLDEGLFWNSPDTILNNIQNYNPLTSKTAAFQDLGYHGSPSKSLQFDARRKAGFNTGVNFMDPYFLSGTDFHIYQAHNSYTAVQYTQGANEMLWLKLTHAQNLKPNLNLGVDFQRLKHDGYYLRQSPSVFNTRIFGHYYGKKYGRYHVLGSAVFNRADIQESGGFRSDSLFEKVEAPVNIYTATSRNKVAENRFSLAQFYRFGKKGFYAVIKDSNTLETDTFNSFQPRWQIFHQFSYGSDRYVYSSRSRDSLLYRNFFLDSFSTFDSIFHRNLKSTQGISFADEEGKLRQWFSLSATVEFHRLFQKNDMAYNFENTSMDVDWVLSYWPSSRYSGFMKLKGALYTSGYNSGNYSVDIQQSISKTGIKRFGIFFSEFAQSYTQPFLLTHLRSNHFKWTDALEKTQVLGGRTGIRFNKGYRELLRFYAQFQSVGNYTYADTALQIRQYSEQLNVLQLFAEGTFSLGNFKFYNQLVYQSDNSDVLRLPSLCSKHSWYYEKNLKFRNPGKVTGRMLFQVGVDAFYRSVWKADAWNPAARTFHLQDQVEIGNYPQLDLWAAAKVKTVDLYLKLEHANQGLMGTRYYTTPHYALYPRSFRFGLLWRFF